VTRTQLLRDEVGAEGERIRLAARAGGGAGRAWVARKRKASDEQLPLRRTD